MITTGFFLEVQNLMEMTDIHRSNYIKINLYMYIYIYM